MGQEIGLFDWEEEYLGLHVCFYFAQVIFLSPYPLSISFSSPWRTSLAKLHVITTARKHVRLVNWWHDLRPPSYVSSWRVLQSSKGGVGARCRSYIKPTWKAMGYSGNTADWYSRGWVLSLHLVNIIVSKDGHHQSPPSLYTYPLFRLKDRV